MSKPKPRKKKVIAPSTAPDVQPAQARVKRRTETSTTTAGRPLTFGRSTYLWMGIGFGLVVLGMLLMLGGRMPDPNTWDPDIIYSAQRTILAPFAMLAGLGVVIYAIFKK